MLVEGYKREAIPKVEIWRAEVGKPLLYPTDPHIVGLASDDALPAALREPVFRRFGLSEIDAIAQFALENAVSI